MKVLLDFSSYVLLALFSLHLWGFLFQSNVFVAVVADSDDLKNAVIKNEEEEHPVSLGGTNDKITILDKLSNIGVTYFDWETSGSLPTNTNTTKLKTTKLHTTATRILQEDIVVRELIVYNVLENTILFSNLKNGTVIDLGTNGLTAVSNLNIVAKTGTSVFSVQFDTSFKERFLVESVKPYTLCGDRSGLLYSCMDPNSLQLGLNTITVTPYTASGGSGTAGTPFTVTFTITNLIIAPTPTVVTTPSIQPPPPPIPLPPSSLQNMIARVDVVNSSSQTIIIEDIGNNVTIDLNDYGIQNATILNFVVIAGSETKSIKFGLNSVSNFRTENFLPYTLCGVIRGRYKSCKKLKMGRNIITMTPYTEDDGLGIAGIPLVLTVTIVTNGAPTTMAPVPAPITSPPVQPPGDNVILINCGASQPFIDSLNRQWLPDKDFIGGTPFSLIKPINNTVDDTIYHYERSGHGFSYKIKVQNGQHNIKLLFAELLRNATIGVRVFDIAFEGSIVLKNIDIVALAKAPSTAIQVSRIVEVLDGTLNIDFIKGSAFIGIPKISGIEIQLLSSHLAHAATGGKYFGTVTNEVFNKANVTLDGQGSHTHDIDSKINFVQWKEGNTVLGQSLKLSHPFTPGLHDVSLTIKDTGNNEDTEKTTVDVRPFGFPAITSMTPGKGSIVGNFSVTIKGSGFAHPSDQIRVRFGTTNALSVTVINSQTLLVKAPPSNIPVPVDVTIKTPNGTSLAFGFLYEGIVPILWTNPVLMSIEEPTVGRFGPDQKLYIGNRRGMMYKITMNPDFTNAIDIVKREILAGHSINGMAFDPMDVSDNPSVYFTLNAFFHAGTLSSSGESVAGKIMKASGALLETLTTVIDGLPVSNYDHGLNGLEFGDKGELYFSVGSFTNGGRLDPRLVQLNIQENFLSGSINVAYVSHPEFDGNIKWSAPDDGDMIAKGIDVFGVGTRNAYGLMLHSNGRLYATDNGPNTGFGRMANGCNGEFLISQKRDDEFILVEQGHYYGHPNEKRAAYFKDKRQCFWIPLETPSNENYTAPLIDGMASSRDGIIEFHSNHFASQLRGNVIVGRFKGTPSLSRIILNSAGTGVVPESKAILPLLIGTDSLDITQAPNGFIVEIRYNLNQIALLIPNEKAVNATTVHTVFPRRGPNGGGNILSIYGINFPKTPTIEVGGRNCPFIGGVTSTRKRVDCILPGGNGTVDIIVRSGGQTSTFAKGYRYISGLLPLDFQIPVYK